MKAFMQLQELSFMAKFMQEVEDFESLGEGYQSDGSKKLIGSKKMHPLKFYVDINGVFVLNYKKSSVDSK